MSNLWPFVIVVSVLVLIGLLISLVATLAPVRKLTQRSSTARLTTVSALALLSLILGFGLWTRLSAEALYTFGTMAFADTFNPRAGSVFWPKAQSKPEIVNELWLRLVVPPPLRHACYSDDPAVCTVIDDLPPDLGAGWSSREYLRDLLIGSVSLLACTGSAWHFTRQRRSLRAAA